MKNKITSTHFSKISLLKHILNNVQEQLLNPFFAFAFLALLNVATGMPSMNEKEVDYKEYLEKRG